MEDLCEVLYVSNDAVSEVLYVSCLGVASLVRIW